MYALSTHIDKGALRETFFYYLIHTSILNKNNLNPLLLGSIFV